MRFAVCSFEGKRERGKEGPANVVLERPVAELVREDVDDGPAAPALLAIGVVGEVVGAHLAEAVLEVVRPRPGIAGRYDDGRRRDEGFRLGRPAPSPLRLLGGLGDGEGHAGRSFGGQAS